MNAHVKIDGNIAVIEGGHELQGALVYATDLRAAAALILLGLRSTGRTRVRNLKYLIWVIATFSTLVVRVLLSRGAAPVFPVGGNREIQEKMC